MRRALTISLLAIGIVACGRFLGIDEERAPDASAPPEPDGSSIGAEGASTIDAADGDAPADVAPEIGFGPYRWSCGPAVEVFSPRVDLETCGKEHDKKC